MAIRPLKTSLLEQSLSAFFFSACSAPMQEMIYKECSKDNFFLLSHKIILCFTLMLIQEYPAIKEKALPPQTTQN